MGLEMKKLKWIGLSFAGILLLLVIAVAITLATIDVNQYKREIEDTVKQQTGRSLLIDGDIEISFFPWLGFSVGKVSLSNAPGFKPDQFAGVDRVNVKLKVWPLLTGDIHLAAIELDGLIARLQRRANGVSNWDDLTTASTANQQAPSEVKEKKDKPSEQPLAALVIGGINISNTNIYWQDQQGGVDLALSDFHLTSDEITPGEFFHIESRFQVTEKGQNIHANIQWDTDAMLDLENALYQLRDLQLSIVAEGDALPVNPLPVKLAASVKADLKQETVSIDELSLDLMSMVAKARVQISQLLSKPVIEGDLHIEDFSPRELLAELALPEITTSDATVLNHSSVSLAFKATPDRADVQKISLKLDDSTISGELSLIDIKRQAVRFDLSVDNIDVDRYLPPAKESTATESKDKPVASAGNSDDAPIALPVELMRSLDIAGQFSFGAVKAGGAKVSDLKLPLTAKKGIVALKPMSANLYEGSMTAVAGVDVRQQIPVFKLKTTLSSIQVEQLLKDVADTDMLSGKGDVSLDISSAGETVGRLKSTLDGQVKISFADGAVKGINLAREARRLKGQLSGKKKSGSQSSQRTDFSSLTATATIVDGIVQNKDLDLRSPLLRVEGKGQVDLPKSYVDYKVRVLVTDNAKGQGGKSRTDLSGLRVSIPIRGHFDQLSSDIVGSIQQAVKEDLKAKLGKKTEAEKTKLKKKLKEERKKEEKKAKEKLEKELNKLFK